MRRKDMSILDQIANVVGDKYVSDEAHIRWGYSRCDTSITRERIPDLVVRPNNKDEISEIVQIANRENTPIWIQGGGTQTCGGGALFPRGILMELTRFRGFDIIEDDNMVIVKAGTTWGELIRTLWSKGLDTFRGPGSGMAATVGGSTSNATAWHGSAHFGGTGDIIRGLEVVLGTGQVIRTSSGSKWPHEFFCRYGGGPDITGLFIGDHGTMGIKTEIGMAMAEKGQYTDAISWMNEDPLDTQNAIIKVAALQIPYDLIFHDKGFFMSYHFYKDQVGIDGVAPEFRRLMSSYFKDIEATNVDPSKMETLCIAILEEHDEEVLRRKMALLEKTVKENKGIIIGKNYAKDWETSQLHAFFEPWKNLEMGRGSNWVGFGGMIKLSEFAKARKLLHDYLEENKEELGKYQIAGAYMGYLHETTCFGVYPCLLGDQWNPESREVVVAHTKKIRDLYLTSSTGWTPYYMGELGSEGIVKAWAGSHYYLLRELKKIFDPNRILNPGMFGL